MRFREVQTPEPVAAAAAAAVAAVEHALRCFLVYCSIVAGSAAVAPS